MTIISAVGPTYCGDGTCDSDEDCYSCSADCDVCSGGGGGGNGDDGDEDDDEENQTEIPESVECSDWGECYVDYGFEDLFEGVENLEGEQKRYCEDKNNIVASFYETRECSVKIEVFVNKTVVDGEDNIDIYDEESKRLVSRIIDRRGEEEPSLDIYFLIDGKFQPDYYETYPMNWFQKVMWLMGF